LKDQEKISQFVFLEVPLIYPKLALKRGLTLILIVPANCNKIALSFDL